MSKSMPARSARQAETILGGPTETVEFSREPGDGTTPGFVYVVHCEKVGLYKIGRSANLVRRLPEIARSARGPVRLVFSVFDRRTAELEAAMHRDFRFARRRGEWFELSEAELSDACLLLAGGE